MGTRNNIAEAMETTTRANTIQATKVVLMALLITATILDIRKQIDIRNIGMNRDIIMELVMTATSLDTSKKIASRKKGMKNKISQRKKN